MVEKPVLAYLQYSATEPEQEAHVPGMLRHSEPAQSLLKVLIAQVTHCECIASEISWAHISLEYKKQKRNSACSSLILFSVKTGCSQFLFYLFRIMYYFKHLVSKSPTETIYKASNSQTANLMGLWYSATEKNSSSLKYADGKGEPQARAEPWVPP